MLQGTTGAGAASVGSVLEGLQYCAPEGSIELVDVNGTQYDLTGKPAFSLCRCGGSVNKPFCDGTHSRIGFQGAELAVKKADG